MKISKFIAASLISASLMTAIFAQSSVFTFQGRLTDMSNPPTAVYQMEFKLFDASAGGNQIGVTITNENISVVQGVFTLSLDFGSNVFTGADRFLEISVRRNAGENYIVLSPRQQISSSPYSIRTISAQQADLALDSNKLGGINASEYLTNSTADSSFIRNSTVQQTGTFNISGDGTIGGTLQAKAVTAQTITGTIGLNQTDGTTNLGTYIGGSSSGATGGWFGTFSNSSLHFFTNNSQPRMTILSDGNITQNRTNGGLIKAMLYVNADGTINRCYNGVTGLASGNCGFTISGSSGTYTVNFGFQVRDRFLSVAAQGIPGAIGNPPTPIGADFRFSTLPGSSLNEVLIDTFRPDTGAIVGNPFMLLVY